MIPWVVAAGAVAVALLVVRQDTRRSGSAAGPVTRLDLDLPPGVELVTVYPPAMVLSPDGTRVGVCRCVSRRRTSCTARRLDQVATVALRGTENANAVFISPDGRALGFITADLALKRVSLADGLVTTIEHDAEFSAGARAGRRRSHHVRSRRHSLAGARFPAARRSSSPRSTVESRNSSTRGQASSRKGGSSCSFRSRAAAAVRHTSRPSRCQPVSDVSSSNPARSLGPRRAVTWSSSATAPCSARHST